MYFFQVGSTDPAECSVNMEYDIFTSRIELVVCIIPEGCYHARVSYNGIALNNGDFDIIVLSCKFNFCQPCLHG